jgi:hypothetical protein
VKERIPLIVPNKNLPIKKKILEKLKNSAFLQAVIIPIKVSIQSNSHVKSLPAKKLNLPTNSNQIG